HPVMGNLLELANLAKVHGSIMSLELVQVTTVVVSSATMAKAILQNHDSSFCNQNPLGYVQENCLAGTAIGLSRAAFDTSINLLSNTIFSVDLANPASDTAREFRDLVRSILEDAAKPNLSHFFPVLKMLDLQGIRRRIKVHFGKLFQLVDRLIDQGLKQRQEHGYTKSKDVPEALSKARLEMEQTIGKGNPIEESDINRLPYLQAAFSLLLPRKASIDVEIAGFTVPKGAQVLVNVWAIGRDESTWDNSHSFMPERFLRTDLNFKGQNFELILFGAGRRICPGSPLAIRMFHLMLGSLIRSFDWKLEDGVRLENMDMEEKFDLTLQKARPLRVVPVAI
ncbi:hypothetical protein CICLE_v10003440mg, partial [Citrus x clementina]